VRSFYAEAGLAEDSIVTFDAFRKWALGTPAVLVFFSGLTGSVKRIMLEKKVEREREKEKAASPPHKAAT
jgi:hypothetical protein